MTHELVESRKVVEHLDKDKPLSNRCKVKPRMSLGWPKRGKGSPVILSAAKDDNGA